MVEPIVVTDTSERQASIRLALERVVVTESRYPAGERGPDPAVTTEVASRNDPGVV